MTQPSPPENQPAAPSAADARVDVIMRTCNRPDLLARAITSVRQQTFDHWHLILVDTGDHQATAEWLAGHPGPGRITHLKAEPGPRIGALSNLGVAAGSAPFVTLLDDDDTWHPGFLATMASLLEPRADDPDLGGVVCHTLILTEEFGDGAWTTLRQEPLHDSLTRLTLPALATVNQFTVNAFLYKRSAWEALGGYDEELPVLDDWHFNLRFLSEYDIEVIPETLAHWHWRSPGDGTPASGVRADHEFQTARLINREIRRKMRGEAAPLAELFVAGELHRLATHQRKRIFSKLRAVSDKVGKIDSRTQRLSAGAGKTKR